MSQSTHTLITRVPRRWLLLVLTIFILTTALRLAWLHKYPRPHANEDEYAQLYLGMSLLSGDPPRSWSQLKVPSKYKQGSPPLGSGNFQIVEPCFDHPPLFPLLLGAIGKMGAASEYPVVYPDTGKRSTLWEMRLSRTRLISVAMSAITFWLLWELCLMISGPAAGLVAVTMYGTLGIIQLHHRLLVPDVLLLPLVLGTFFILEKWRRAAISTRTAAIGVVACVSLAAFTKIIGFSLVAAVVAWISASFSGRKALKLMAWPLLGAVLGVGLNLGYAALYDFEAFLATMRAHSGRFDNLNGLMDLVRESRLMMEPHFDQWMISGWTFAFTCAIAAPRRARPYFIAMLGYGVAYVFFAPRKSAGWYAIPFYPMISAAWGVTFSAACRNPRRPVTILLYTLLAASMAAPWIHLHAWLRWPARYFYLLAAPLVLLPWGIVADRIRIRTVRVVLAAMLAVGLLGELLRQYLEFLKAAGKI